MADHGPDIRADTRWLTYEEAGHVLGVDPDSVARRARRLKWPRLPGNDGKARVAIPADILPASGPDAAPDQGADGAADKEPYSPRDRGGHVRPDESRTIKALEDEAAALREALARERERADRAEAQAAAALAMADRRGREVVELRERVGQAEGASGAFRGQVKAERDRADQAEARAGQAEAEREAARAEREAAKVAAASTEGEAKGLRLALEEARRPFWRRWLGQ
jgi:hypothetical protein